MVVDWRSGWKKTREGEDSMIINHTVDSPILIKLTPESLKEAFENGQRAESMKRMNIPHRVESDGSLVLNIDPVWKDFAETSLHQELNPARK
jgi:hypothetical protein